MDMESIYKALSAFMPPGTIERHVPMSGRTSFRIGGPADLLIEPADKEMLRKAVLLCKAHEVPFYIMGNGSNLLVSDKGFRGVVIQLFKQMQEATVEGDRIRTGAGLLLSSLSKLALRSGLEGLAFASGIPGTVGGAIYMNAGAYGGEIKDVLVEATIVDHEGRIKTLSAGDLELGYRTSALQGTGDAIVEAVFQLRPGDREAIREAMRDFDNRRRSKQPLEYPSAGSTFKRPEGYYAGKLIMDAGLSGFRIGDAMVSEKHCGFVVNDGQASCQEVLALIEHVKATVKARFGVEMEPEVRIIGEF